MDLLTIRLGDVPVALASSQVSRVDEWPARADVPVAELGRCTGIAAPAASTGRLLVCSAPAEMAFVVPPTAVVQRHARPGELLKVPALLRRLRAPFWLAGLARFDDELFLLIDLHLLSITAADFGLLTEPAATPRGP